MTQMNYSVDVPHLRVHQDQSELDLVLLTLFLSGVLCVYGGDQVFVHMDIAVLLGVYIVEQVTL